MKTLQDLLEHEIKDLCSAESQLIEALPKMAEAASHADLKAAFEAHLQETKDQRERLTRICQELGLNPGNTQCHAMTGLIDEGESMIKDAVDADVRDAGLIACAQRVEHYEIAGYGAARYFAQLLRHEKAAELLAKTLQEEIDADAKLNDIAIETVNRDAALVRDEGDGKKKSKPSSKKPEGGKSVKRRRPAGRPSAGLREQGSAREPALN